LSYFEPFGVPFDVALAELGSAFESLPQATADALGEDGVEALQAVAQRMGDNYPYHHPLYIGQMLKPPHPVARQAYALAQYINPNNHALDGGRASSRMEKEAVAQIAVMIGWDTHLGHLCGGGTMANFEALWVGREEFASRAEGGHEAGAVVASAAAHYTHQRLSAVLGVPFAQVPLDSAGGMDVTALRSLLDQQAVATVVATLGSTAMGAVDPLPQLLALREEYGFRLHVDGAYGGYFGLSAKLAPAVRDAYECVSQADSFVVDPHKHGLQPYGCGCVIFRDPAVGRHYQHDSPYTYFSSDELHLGEISLECSRAGAAAVALWATQRALPLVPGGDFASGLDHCLLAARRLHTHLSRHATLVPLQEPALDIVVWAVRGPSATVSSALAQEIFEEAARLDLHLAVVSMPQTLCVEADPVGEWDAPVLVCLRACAMKPQHLAWLNEVTDRLDRAVDAALARHYSERPPS
jgi:tyrosine decarboxylase/aspartate 1-decarboxylase